MPLPNRNGSSLPASFFTDGFQPMERTKYRRLLLGTDGPAGSGKSEFMLSAPGPGIAICVDRAIDTVYQNPNPPPTRRDDFAIKIVKAPLNTQATQAMYLDYWKQFYAVYLKALDNKDARTVDIDGDSDTWELQRLAEFGKLTQIPSILYTNVNAARRAMYARAWDSGKIIIATNKISKQYRPKIDPKTGLVELNNQGKEIREWDGKTYDRQGFADQDYLWHLQIRHIYRIIPTLEYGIKIMMCKADRLLEGMELWGPDCNFQSLVQTVYPHIPLEEWGY